MENNKYITVQELLAELRDHPMLEDLTLERVITYAVDFCRKWGANVLFDEKTATIKAEDYRAVLPCDFYELIAVRDHCSKLNYRYSSDVFHIMHEEDKPKPPMKSVCAPDIPEPPTPPEPPIPPVPPVPPTPPIPPDEHHHHHHHHPPIPPEPPRPFIRGIIPDNMHIVNHELLTYKLNGNVLFLSTKCNEIDVVYQAIATDNDGYPLILDDATYIQALKDYIKLQRFTILFDMGKLQSGILQNAQQQYGFSARVLRNHIAMPSPDKVESITNILNNMIIHRDHYRGYKHTSEHNPTKNY